MGEAIGLLVLLLCGAALAFAALYDAPRRGAARAPGPWCRRCGYSLRSLRAAACPECAADLTSPRSVWLGHGERGPQARLALWLLGVALMTGASVFLLRSPLVPRVWTWQAGWSWLGPPSGALSQIVFHGHDERVLWWGEDPALVRPRTVTVTLHDAHGRTAQLEVHGDWSHRYREASGSLVQGAELTVPAIETWMRRSGLGLEAHDLRREAIGIYDSLDIWFTHDQRRPLIHGGILSTVSVRPVVAFGPPWQVNAALVLAGAAAAAWGVRRLGGVAGAPDASAPAPRGIALPSERQSA